MNAPEANTGTGRGPGNLLVNNYLFGKKQLNFTSQTKII
jgi:hypothetical protein